MRDETTEQGSQEPQIPEVEKREARVEWTDPTVEVRMPELGPLVKAMAAGSPEGRSILDKVRTVWAVVEPFTESSIRAAEVIYSPGTGPSKKAFVTGQVMALLRAAEERADWIPDWLEPIVWKGLQMAVSPMIERLLTGLKQKGVIPA